ncbi:MAG: helix-turn-helix transcriptional regulator [Chloroflexota bacterium]|nr:helix-turn-helix transcriptional regulator [Chloroflexota bacterium]
MLRLRGWTQSDLARASGVHVSYINQLVTGRRTNPGLATLEQLARAFGVASAVLVDRRMRDQDLRSELSRAQLRLAIKTGVRDHRTFYKFIDTPLAPVSVEQWQRLRETLEIAETSGSRRSTQRRSRIPADQ